MYEGPHFQRSKSISTSESGVKVDTVFYYHYATHSICISLIGIWICEVYNCKGLLKTFICKIFGFAVFKSSYWVNVIIPHFTYFLSFISRFLLVNLSKFGAGMLIKFCSLPLRSIKSVKLPGLRPGPRWESLQRSPRPPSWI